jgi:hypothetical protein
MMDDKHPFASAPAETTAKGPEAQPAAADGTAQPTPASAAVMKFKSCRWRSDPEAGEFCTHRDVLPFAGKEGFNAESWCPDCEYYKLRRTPRKRERVDYSY